MLGVGKDLADILNIKNDENNKGAYNKTNIDFTKFNRTDQFVQGNIK